MNGEYLVQDTSDFSDYYTKEKDSIDTNEIIHKNFSKNKYGKSEFVKKDVSEISDLRTTSKILYENNPHTQKHKNKPYLNYSSDKKDKKLTGNYPRQIEYTKNLYPCNFGQTIESGSVLSTFYPPNKKTNSNFLLNYFLLY